MLLTAGGAAGRRANSEFSSDLQVVRSAPDQRWMSFTKLVFLLQSEAAGGLSREGRTSETQTVQHPDPAHHPPNPEAPSQRGCQPSDTRGPQLCFQEGPAQEGTAQTAGQTVLSS